MLELREAQLPPKHLRQARDGVPPSAQQALVEEPGLVVGEEA